MNRQMRNLWLIASVTAFAGGCSTAPIVTGDTPNDAYYTRDRMVLDDADAPIEVYDPWEGMNRSIYRFNSHLDRYALLPIVSAYEFVFPQFVRNGVKNFFTNFDNIQTLLNEVLQLRPVEAVQTTGRLVVNTTIGLVGLFDVATPLGIPQHEEDFGQTLGRYGVRPGPYLVLPFFGPSFVRDAGGRGVDLAAINAIDPLQLDDSASRTAIYYSLLIPNTRANVSFRYYDTGSPFEYELVRLLWSTKREIDIEK